MIEDIEAINDGITALKENGLVLKVTVLLVLQSEIFK